MASGLSMFLHHRQLSGSVPVALDSCGSLVAVVLLWSQGFVHSEAVGTRGNTYVRCFGPDHDIYTRDIAISVIYERVRVTGVATEGFNLGSAAFC